MLLPCSSPKESRFPSSQTHDKLVNTCILVRSKFRRKGTAGLVSSHSVRFRYGSPMLQHIQSLLQFTLLAFNAAVLSGHKPMFSTLTVPVNAIDICGFGVVGDKSAKTCSAESLPDWHLVFYILAHVKGACLYSTIGSAWLFLLCDPRSTEGLYCIQKTCSVNVCANSSCVNHTLRLF